jgi:hypothetical protein
VQQVSRWFAVVDGAADPRLYDVIAAAREHACLYSGDYDAETRKALPYLVALEEGDDLPRLWRAHEAGRFWGILIRSVARLSELRRHLRHFTTARLPLGDVVLFRFWDPRVFATFAVTESDDQVGEFFAPIEVVIADLGDAGRKRFEWQGGILADGRRPDRTAA